MSERMDTTSEQGDDDLKLAALTRDDVAKRLDVSISTVRRLEGTRLHPSIDDKSVRRFKASDVERLAKEMQAEQRSPRNAQQAVVRAAEMPNGELAAEEPERGLCRSSCRDGVANHVQSRSRCEGDAAPTRSVLVDPERSSDARSGDRIRALRSFRRSSSGGGQFGTIEAIGTAANLASQ